MRKGYLPEEVFLEEVFFFVEDDVFFAVLFLEEPDFLAATFLEDFFEELTDDFLDELFFEETAFFDDLEDDFFTLDLPWPDLARAFLAAAASASVPLVTTCLGVGRYTMGFICLLS